MKTAEVMKSGISQFRLGDSKQWYTRTYTDRERHYYPDWMSLKLHLILENLLNNNPLYNKPITGAFIDILLGLTCGYTWRETIQFIINPMTAPHHEY